ncbi:MAG: GntR family transcriptional regulator [Cyclonatronaceae bacterium]
MNAHSHLVPKYYQIYEELLDQIRDGQFKEKDRFPSDTELVEKYKVSRGTIREAIKLLFQQGFIVREQGKGTFVTYNKIEQNPDKLIGFTELMKRHNIKPTARIVEKVVVDAPPNIRQLLQLDHGGRAVRIVRIRYGDNKPLIIERSWFNEHYFRPVFDMDLEKNSIYELLYRHTQTRLGMATQRIEAISAGQSELEYLKVPLGTPLLLIKRLIQTKEGDYFQYSEDAYRSDRISFTTTTVPYELDHNPDGLPLDLIDKDWQDN